jgi:cyclopropane fatty-acyl-phospholipid synthase-like methyltransferase
MTRDEFQRLMSAEFEKIVAINNTKGHDYAGEQDALRNFKDQAQRSGITKEQVWSVLFTKHMMAIETYVAQGAVASEPIEGRIHDAILYLFLLRGLVEESRRNI